MLMGITEYARHRNCGLQAVQYAVKAGRIHRNPDGLIDSERADREWEANTLHTNARYGPRKPREESEAASGHVQAGRHRAATHAAKHAAAEMAEGLDAERRQIGAADFNKARAAKELYEARLKKLEYEQRLGKVVLREEVEREAFNSFRVLRDAAFNIPDRIANQLAGETDQAMVYEILHRELAQVFRDFAAGKREESAA